VGGDSFRLVLGGKELLDFAPGNITVHHVDIILEDIGSNISGIFMVFQDISHVFLDIHRYNLGYEKLEVSVVYGKNI